MIVMGTIIQHVIVENVMNVTIFIVVKLHAKLQLIVQVNNLFARITNAKKMDVMMKVTATSQISLFVM